jgi:hypothetical protein
MGRLRVDLKDLSHLNRCSDANRVPAFSKATRRSFDDPALPVLENTHF